nr:hypothetical protein [Tanacetum cinerariifolium]
MVEGTKNVDENEFMDEIFISQEDLSTRLDPRVIREELTVADPTSSSSNPKPKKDHFKNYKSVFHKMRRIYGYIFRHLKKSFMPRKDFTEMANTVKSTMKKVVPLMVDKRFNKIAKKLVPLYVAEGLLLDMQKAQTDIAALVTKAVKKEGENIRAELSMHVTNIIAN